MLITKLLCSAKDNFRKIAAKGKVLVSRSVTMFPLLSLIQFILYPYFIRVVSKLSAANIYPEYKKFFMPPHRKIGGILLCRFPSVCLPVCLCFCPKFNVKNLRFPRYSKTIYPSHKTHVWYVITCH